MRWAPLPAMALALAACGGAAPPPESAPAFNVDAARITVSGVSSGAMMATQLHLAHSRLIGGAALLAGGPYYCAEASLKKGLGACMQGGDLGVAGLVAYARQAGAAGTIDAPGNLADDSVWVFHGARDNVVHPDLAAGAVAFYEALGVTDLTLVDDVPVAHGVPTLATGAACDVMEAPYLNACDYDGAGELLGALYGALAPRADASGELLRIAQPGAGDATMLPEAYLYVPAACRDGAACGVHIALHGCQQSAEFVGDAFAAGAGYNEWAEGNRLLVLYPQVASSKIAPLNPMGCWDWWGYTDAHYATQRGAQVRVIKAMLDGLAGRTL